MRADPKFARARGVRVRIPAKALEAIFDECDRFEVEETGGRLFGTFTNAGGTLTINVSGVIEAGPDARRSNASFFQDGAHQERVFRKVERLHPEIEHLGNWHTHHVNGFASLSGGDVQTYQRIVNHPSHNTSFLYALLITNREKSHSRKRYQMKHYVLHRGDPRTYEIDRRHIEVTDEGILWPQLGAVVADATERGSIPTSYAPSAQIVRAYDSAVIRDLYSRLRPFTSPRVGIYWRGFIELVDGSKADVMVVESDSMGTPSYTVGFPDMAKCLEDVKYELDGRRFSSASAALVFAERTCNRVLYAQVNQARVPEKGRQ